jgi:AbrB family looped-hinge helix DNA binding protein
MAGLVPAIHALERRLSFGEGGRSAALALRSAKHATKLSASKTCHAKLSAKRRTVLPRAVRTRLRISPGDRLRFLVDDRGVRIEKAGRAVDGEPFAAFSEWSTEVDEEAFRAL